MISRTQLHSTESTLDRLAEQICDQLQEGNLIQLEELIRQYPDLEDRLRVIYPTVLAMADWSSGQSDREIDGALSDAWENRQIGDFRILRQIGRGGMGLVYEAQQQSISRRVALKMLPLAALIDDRALQRFKNEVAAIATLEHPHIVAVYAIGEERGIHYYAMKLVHGQSLAAVVNELRSRSERPESLTGESIGQVVADLQHKDSGVPSPLSIDTMAHGQSETVPGRITDPVYFRNVARLMLQATDALQHAHDHGIIHRDVKPGNLLLDTDGCLFVTDFGLARIETAPGVTMTGDLLGTLRYMSPEQVQPRGRVVDHRTDVYSLGVTLYELLTLQPMWSGHDKAQLLQQISLGEPTRPGSVNPAIPTDLETIILKAINKRPDERYDSVAAMGHDLQRWLDHQPIVARRPSAWIHLKKWSFRHRRTITTAAAVALVSLAVGLILAFNAYRAREAERDRARNNYRVAMTALDDLVENAAEYERMVDVEGWRQTTLQRALDHYSRFATHHDSDPIVGEDMLEVVEKQARIHLLLQNFDQAESLARKGIRRFDTSSGFNNPVTLATLWRHLAQARQQLAQTELATEAWNKVDELIAALTAANQPIEADDRLQIARLLKAHAQWQSVSGHPAVAMQSLFQAAQQCELADTQDTVSEPARFLLGEIKEDIADHYRAADQPSEAASFYNEALALARDLGGSRGHLQLLAKCLRQLGAQQAREKRGIPQAEAHYRDAIAVYDQLVDEYPWDVYCRAERTQLLQQLSAVLTKQGKGDEARQALQRAAANQEFALRHQPKQANRQLFWANVQSTLGQINRDLKEYDSSRKHYEASLEQLSRLADRWRNHRSLHEQKARVHLDYAAMIHDQPGVFGNVPVAAQAEDQIRQALSIYLRLQSQFPEIEVDDDRIPEFDNYYTPRLINTYTALAKSLQAQQRYDEAEHALRNALAEFELAPKRQSPGLRYEMADTMLDLAGTCLMRDDDPVEVERMYRDGLKMMETAYADNSDVVTEKQYHREMSTHYWGLALSLFDQGRYDESKREFQRARSFGPMWTAGLSFFAGQLIDGEDEASRDHELALECFEELLQRVTSSPRPDPENETIYRFRIGQCHYRLGHYKQAKRIFAELMTAEPNNKLVPGVPLGYYMVMTLAQIDEADDTEGTFHKADAAEGFTVATDSHDRMLEQGKLSPELQAEYSRLRQEAAALLGVQED